MTTPNESCPRNNNATTIVHWPGNDVLACDKHADQLAALGNMMGTRISMTPANGGSCVNCENEKERDNAS